MAVIGQEIESVSAPLRGALGVTCPGVNRLRRFNITLRYAHLAPDKLAEAVAKLG